MCVYFIVNPSWVNIYYVNPYLLIKFFEKLNIKVKRMILPPPPEINIPQ